VRRIVPLLCLALVCSSVTPALAKRPASPKVYTISPNPVVAHPNMQTLTVAGADFKAGLVPSIGTASAVTATSFEWTVMLNAATTIGLRVMNPDGRVSNLAYVVVTAPSPPPTQTQPPAIMCPAPQAATSISGNPVPVSYPNPTVTGGAAPVTTSCAPASGASFAVGSTNVSCIATDALQQKASCTFPVTVMAPVAAAPAIVCPANLTVSSPDGKAVSATFSSPTVTGGAAPVTTSCSPASGSSFALGQTAVMCKATDSQLRSNSCQFSLTVTAPAAPTITCSAAQTVQATTSAGATVNYAAPTVTGAAAPVAVTSQPASGSVFPIGTTTVTATATDALNRSASCTIPITVTPAPTTTFAIGDRVAAGPNGVLVRSTPAIVGDSTVGNGNTLALDPPGTLGTIIAGPTVADGYRWWQINYDTGADGWSTEEYLIKSSTPPPASTKFVIGDRVAAGPNGVLVRSTPAIVGDSTVGSGNTLALDPPGALGTVVGGPTVADNYTWWQINYDTGADGWSTEDYLVKSSGTSTPPPSTKFVIGDRVMAGVTGALARSTPGFGTNGNGDNVLGLHSPGEFGTVTGGPQVVEGYIWWAINYDTGWDGWSTEPNLDKATSSTTPTATLALEWSAGPITIVPDTVPANYKLSYGVQPGSYTNTVAVGPGTTHTLTGLQPLTTYFAVVSACNDAGGCGPNSTEVSGSTR
jgi:HYR domain